MEQRRLGRSGLQVSVLTLGAWQLGDPEYWGPVAHEQAKATVEAAVEAGVTLFDTAEWYGAGESERVLGALLAPHRANVLIASKVSPQNCTRDGVRQACEASLRRLNTDVIDLYQVHWPNREVPFAETCEAMCDLQEKGKIRAIGVSNFGSQDLGTWLDAGACASDQIGYNAVFRAPEYEIIPACIEYDLGVLVYMPLMQGILTGRWKTVEAIPAKRRRTRHFASTREGTMHTEPGEEGLLLRTLGRLEELARTQDRTLADLAVAWVARQPGVTSVIVGAGKPEQLRRNAAAENGQRDDDTLAEVDAITEPLKSRLGSNADMWKSGDDARIR